MNCNCVKKNEERLAKVDFIQQKAGTNAKAECTATVFMLDDEMGLKSNIRIPFRVRGSGKGYSGTNGKVHDFIAGYCPFCGLTTGRYVVGEYEGMQPLRPTLNLGELAFEAETTDAGGV